MITDTHTTLTFLPDGREVLAPTGETILNVARAAGVTVDAPCGDRGLCGKCRVFLRDGQAGPVTDEERALLSTAELAAGVRLACEARVVGPITVEVPETSRNLAGRKGAAVLPRTIVPDSRTRKIAVCVSAPSLTGGDLRSDLTRLRDVCPEIADADLAALRELPGALAGHGAITALLRGGRLLGVDAGDTTAAHYGVALDVGTTTVVGYLMDLRTGADVAAQSRPNPQSGFGADVISRIEYAGGDAEKVRTLQSAVLGAVNEILHALAADAGCAARDIVEMTVVGNTCMGHLFLGIDPVALGHAPYVPVVTDPVSLPAGDLGLAMHPRGCVRTLPNIAGFVGADTVGVLAASDLAARPGLWAAVDIGTNAEVLVAIDGQVSACSTAAGPAFEGARISQGMRAQPGAIDAVVIGRDVFTHTLADAPALGICGSGIIDAVGELRRVGILESTGRFAEPEDLAHLPEPVRARLRDDAFVLAWAAEGGTGADIAVTQRDVREVQLVKAAIFAGVATMLDKLGKRPEDLDGLLIAGAFGTYISKEHAIGIGLIPNLSLEKLHFLGNAAGAGAKMALLSAGEEAGIVAAARQVRYVELAGDPTFADHFMTAMTLAPGCEDW